MVAILGVDKLGHAAICIMPYLIQNFHVFIGSKDKLVDIAREWTETSGLIIDIATGKPGILEECIKLIVRNIERSEPTKERIVSMNSERIISKAPLRKVDDFLSRHRFHGSIGNLSVMFYVVVRHSYLSLVTVLRGLR